MVNRRGILGGTMVTFVATIVIVIILLIFVIGASVIKVVDKSAGGLRVYDEAMVGLRNVDEYMKGNYLKLVSVRFFVAKDEGVNGAIGRAGYNE